MCQQVGLAADLGISFLAVVLPLAVIPVGVAVLAWYRGGRAWTAISAIVAVLATVFAFVTRPVAETVRDGATQLAVFLQRNFVFPEGLAGVAWFCALAWPRMKAAALAATLVVGAWGLVFLGAVLVRGTVC